MYQFIPHPPFNVVYRDEFVIASFQHCLGGEGGVPIPVISLLILCKIAFQCILNSCYLIQACQGLLSGIVGSFKLPWVQWHYPILSKNATQKTWAKVNVKSKIHYYGHEIIKKLKQFCIYGWKGFTNQTWTLNRDQIDNSTILLWIIYLTNLGSALFHSKTCQHSILISYYNLVVSM